jgi:NADH dehydrogenase
MVLKRTAAVTGAFSYTGSYIARALLERGWDVNTLTRDPNRPHPLQGRVKAFPLDFANPYQLQKYLKDVHTLVNTYWVRFNYPGSSFDQAVENSRMLIQAAESAGVKRVIHISVSNADLKSSLPYYRGKAEVEEIIKASKLSYAILQPTLIFGKEEVLVHNIAWLLRHFPAFAIAGAGSYRVQPISVEDLAELAAQAASTAANQVLPAAGPEVYTYSELIDLLRQTVRSRALVLHLPPWLTLLLAKIVGFLLGDVTLTREELQGLMEERLYIGEPILGKTSFSQWAMENRETLGVDYRNELKRHHKLHK